MLWFCFHFLRILSVNTEFGIDSSFLSGLVSGEKRPVVPIAFPLKVWCSLCFPVFVCLFVFLSLAVRNLKCILAVSWHRLLWVYLVCGFFSLLNLPAYVFCQIWASLFSFIIFLGLPSSSSTSETPGYLLREVWLRVAAHGCQRGHELWWSVQSNRTDPLRNDGLPLPFTAPGCARGGVGT